MFQAQKLINVMPRLVLRDQGVAWAKSPGTSGLLGEIGLAALATAVPSDLAVHSACAVSNALRNSANGKAFS